MKFVNWHDEKIISSAKGSSTGKTNKEGRNQGKKSFLYSCFPHSNPHSSRRQFFTVRLLVAAPAGQGGVAGVFKKKLQRRRFGVAVANYHVGFALMTKPSSTLSIQNHVKTNNQNPKPLVWSKRADEILEKGELL
ncbi:MAG TPA: hypothetical protein VMV89_07255 [Candidatus Paceibacterota bacterium]|nr:hypothetical protein [Candidatus Paceibacterota bacterium]